MSPKLPIVSGQEVIKALEKGGFVFISQRGSHVKLQHKKGNIAIVPLHHELSKGTLKSILRQAGMDVEDFMRLLAR